MSVPAPKYSLTTIRKGFPSVLEIGGYRIEVDVDSTLQCYQHPIDGPFECACWYCRNWIEGRDRLLPKEVKALLQQLGIPQNGEIEVWQVPGDILPHGYGGWYMFVGSLIVRPDEEKRQFSLGGWQVSFSVGSTYEVSAFQNRQTVELHFFTEAETYIDDAELSL